MAMYVDNKKYNLTEFRELHNKTVQSHFTNTFNEPFLFISAEENPSPIIFPLPDRTHNKEVTVGSKAGCSIELPHQVSAVHLRLFFHKILNAWCIEDQDTKTGTVLDGKQIATRSVHTLNEYSIVQIADYKIQFYPVSRMADIIFSSHDPSSHDPSSHDSSSHDSPSPEVPDASKAPTKRVKEVENKNSNRVQKFLDVLTRGCSQTLLPLIMECRYLGLEDFLEAYKHPFLFLHKVIINKDRPAIYTRSEVAPEQRIFWQVKPEGIRQVVTIGRSEYADISLQAKVISKLHAEIKQENGDWYLRDVGSVNHVYIDSNVVPARQWRILYDKALISISPHIRLHFLLPETMLKLLSDVQANI
jgi:pSer/pThr/pTyr-binding forkhead associated (FHA) protein